MSTALQRPSLVDLFERMIVALDAEVPYWSEDFEAEDIWAWVERNAVAVRDPSHSAAELALRCIDELEQALDDSDTPPLFA